MNQCPCSVWGLLALAGTCRAASSCSLSCPLLLPCVQHHPSWGSALQTWMGSCSVQGSASVCVGGFAIKLLSPWGRKRGVGGVTSVRAPVGLNSPDQPHLRPLPLHPVYRAMPRTLCPSLHLRSGLSLQSSFMKLPSCCCCLTSGSAST